MLCHCHYQGSYCFFRAVTIQSKSTEYGQIFSYLIESPRKYYIICKCNTDIITHLCRVDLRIF